jgi:RND family efflux transporter MFP subunit
VSEWVKTKTIVVLACAVGVGAGFVACKTTTKGDDTKGAKAGGAKGGGAKGAKGGSGVKYPVDVYAVESKRIDYLITGPGSIDAFERVQVTARVSGAVDRIAFSEGQQVKKGDALVVIDSERYQSAVNSAKAAVAKAEASQKDAEAMIARRQGALDAHPGLIPGEELATYETKGLTAKADTQVVKESLHAAELNLRDSFVRAPMVGIIQTRTVETGQFVQAGTIMATLLRDDPMLLRFQVAPLEAPRVKPGMIAQFKLRETTRTFQAKVTLVAGAADDSHMVGVTAEIVKEEHKYWLRPGSFCDVTLSVGATRDAVVIPRAAVRPTERGFVSYVIEDGIAHEHILQLGSNTSDGWVEVREGLKAGEKLVIRGGEPLAEGSLVESADAPPPVSTAFASAGPADSSSVPPIVNPAPSSSASPSSSAHRREQTPKGKP